MNDDIAYKCVKAMKWIIDNASSKAEANDILATLQDRDIHKVLQNIKGYEALPDTTPRLPKE